MSAARKPAASSAWTPATVCAASAIATWRGSPIFTPPSASASMARKMNAGPEPERPVTASSRCSSTTTVVPTASNSATAWPRSASVACGPRASAVAPAPTRAGVFGIVRTIRAVGPSLRAMAEIGTPAAIDTTSFRASIAGAISSRSASMTCGFTERMRMSACFTAARLLAVTATPCRVCSSSRRSARGSAHTSSSGAAVPAASSPFTRASAMFPEPRNAIFFPSGMGRTLALPDDEILLRPGPLPDDLHPREARAERRRGAREPREEAERRAEGQPLLLRRVAHSPHELAALRLREVEAGAEERYEGPEPRLERLGREDLVAHRPVRERHPRERRDLLRPGAAGEDDRLARDAPAVGPHGGDPRAGGVEARHAGEGGDARAERLRARRVAPKERPREDDAVVRVPRRSDETPAIELGDDRSGLVCAHDPGAEPLAPVKRGIPLEPRLLGPRRREEEIAAPPEPDVHAEVDREPRAQRDRAAGEPDHRGGPPLRAHAAAVPARGAGVERAALEHEHVADAPPSELVGEREPHDPAAHDDDVRAGGERRQLLPDRDLDLVLVPLAPTQVLTLPLAPAQVMT